jgi:hypothetical protein
VLTDMDNWTEIRRRVLVDGHSMRSVQREFHLHWKTLRKILDHPEWTSPRLAGAEVRFYAAISYSAGDLYPSDECRRTRLKKTSMYSNRLALAHSRVSKVSP